MKDDAIVKSLQNATEEWLSSCAWEPSLQQAARYMLIPGGKYLRGTLLAALFHDITHRSLTSFHAPLAIELLHCASLIHDDLPCMDNDAERRGQPSCHVKFNEATALLAGDLLVGEAFRLIGSLDIDPTRLRHAIQILSVAWIDLCSGQALDVASPLHFDSLLQLHDWKTGALFSATFQIAALLAHSELDVVKEAGEFGRTFGRIFQIVDDIDDLDQDNSSTEQRPFLEECLASHRERCHVLLPNLETRLSPLTRVRTLISPYIRS
jgi:geranylgeranyl pyrophosphate synthase